MNPKVWLIVFGVVAALALGGGGFYAASNHGKYREAMDGWGAKVSSIESLERRVPYPNKKNTEALAEKVESYRSSVDALEETLKSFQRPLNTTLANTNFQQLVKTRVEEFRRVAGDGGMEIDSTNEFQLGFDIYANTVPAPALVPVLDYELEAIDHLLRKLVACGVERLSEFQRDAIPGEPGGPAVQDDGPVHKYPVRFRIRGSHDTLQKLVNELANDRQFFYIVRVLKVRNESQEGAPKLTGGPSQGGFVTFQNPDTKEVASPEMLSEWGHGTAPESEVAAKAREAGFIKADQDARVLMGLEKLDAFLVVDIARFLGADELKKEEPEAETETKKKGRR